MNKFMDRGGAEIAMFAAAFFGIWMFFWSIILTNIWMGAVAFVLVLGALAGFAIRDAD